MREPARGMQARNVLLIVLRFGFRFFEEVASKRHKKAKHLSPRFAPLMCLIGGQTPFVGGCVGKSASVVKPLSFTLCRCTALPNSGNVCVDDPIEL